ncbi:predicted protein [Postia placenta Mad-698-R]|nr:predicted protein [Postia placenta Mad-698-R]
MGNALSNALQAFPPKSKFSTDQIPDLSGQVIIVYMASRSKDKADTAIQELKAQTDGKEAIFLELDLGNLASVRKAAEDKETELHVLVNNAGVMWPPVDHLTSDGYDLQFGTNVLGHFFFTKLLIPALVAGAGASQDQHSRIVNVSSSASYLETLHWNTFKDSAERKKMSPNALYCQSKFGNVVVAREFAKRYADKGIVSTSLNPGNIETDLLRYVSPLKRRLLNLLLYPASQGALTQLWAGTMPETLDYNGKFLIPWARVGRCRKEAYDDQIGERLWN